MISSAILNPPYTYVQTESVLSDVIELLELDLSPSGIGPTSIVISRERAGEANLMKLKGLGKYLWKGIDAQAYVDELRNEWEK